MSEVSHQSKSEAPVNSSVMPIGPQNPNSSRKSPSRPACKFYQTKSGCRSGDRCPFRHDLSEAPPSAIKESGGQPHQEESIQRQAQGSTAVTRATGRSAQLPRAMSRPVSKLEKEDPRLHQIQQVKRRFPSTTEDSARDGSTTLLFELPPSDPDFPFDIGNLKCSIRVPKEFPAGTAPTLHLRNQNIDRGYSINVETAFSNIWSQSSRSTLFGTIKILDNRLEEILTAQKSETIKIIPNTGPKNLASSRTEPTPSDKPALIPTAGGTKDVDKNVFVASPQQQETARKKRQVETQVLEHRLRTNREFSKKADGNSYIVPLEPRKAADLSPPLRSVRTVKLSVPPDYDTSPCEVELLSTEGRPAGASNIEAAFKEHAQQHRHLTLLAHLNWLAQNMSTIANESPVQTSQEQTATELKTLAPEASNTPSESSAVTLNTFEFTKDHVKYIPRPPEWLIPAEARSDSDSDYSSSSEASDDDDSHDDEDVSDNGRDESKAASSSLKEMGILLSFPSLELFGVELLELISINVTVKCTRCKDTSDITKVQSNEPGGYVGVRTESCKKCAFPFGVGYRKDMMHAKSVRAGYLDLDGCTPVDLLPSSFIPTCSSCSTPYPKPGITAVRGDASIAICRECHQRMTFKLGDTKFLRVGTAAVQANKDLPRKKKKESLGIVAGQELPKHGKCKHYGKSYRWFRFSCCDKVFPCDKCHDDAFPDHPNEFATRMICGFCSREQNFRPEDCGICKSKLTGKAGTGFWEGGKGTRDRTRMSRKDPRKYKRRPGSKIKT